MEKKGKRAAHEHFGGTCCLHLQTLNEKYDRSRRQYKSKQQTSNNNMWK